ncbi:hypothetical protein BJ508DRAFT_324011 [Ascobolus immersus RN42]|uniref:Uncharacterized protein n=1 Tax=Ascobolus immersus RN42 TaxID=1160509 RepID=A0A3N4ID29_ASCIM|nr:hypothetical protein BJ508DRAFT_324011 [Ascobolus immersus RN42]
MAEELITSPATFGQSTYFRQLQFDLTPRLDSTTLLATLDAIRTVLNVSTPHPFPGTLSQYPAWQLRAEILRMVHTVLEAEDHDMEDDQASQLYDLDGLSTYWLVEPRLFPDGTYPSPRTLTRGRQPLLPGEKFKRSLSPAMLHFQTQAAQKQSLATLASATDRRVNHNNQPAPRQTYPAREWETKTEHWAAQLAIMDSELLRQEVENRAQDLALQLTTRTLDSHTDQLATLMDDSRANSEQLTNIASDMTAMSSAVNQVFSRTTTLLTHKGVHQRAINELVKRDLTHAQAMADMWETNLQQDKSSSVIVLGATKSSAGEQPMDTALGILRQMQIIGINLQQAYWAATQDGKWNLFIKTQNKYQAQAIISGYTSWAQTLNPAPVFMVRQDQTPYQRKCKAKAQGLVYYSRFHWGYDLRWRPDGAGHVVEFENGVKKQGEISLSDLLTFYRRPPPATPRCGPYGHDQTAPNPVPEEDIEWLLNSPFGRKNLIGINARVDDMLDTTPISLTVVDDQQA